MTPARSARRGVVWGIFVTFACLYALSIGRGFYTSDGDVMFQATAALVERGTLALPPDADLPQIVAGAGGRYYSKYDAGLSLAMVPFFVAGDRIAQVNAAHRYRVAAAAVLLVPALAAAGALAGTAWIGACVAGTRPALPVVLAAGIASPLWWYGRVLFAEAALACALAWAVALLWDGESRGRTRSEQAIRELPLRVVIAGMAFGAGIAVRAAFAIYAPALVWLIWRTTNTPTQRVWPRLVAFGAGCAPGIALVLWHNALRFGDPFVSGYAGEGFTTPPWKGIAGLLVSPGRGALITAPSLVLNVLLWRRLHRRAPALAGLLVLAWGAALPFYGAWWAWDGGWCWGPRLVVPLIPLSMLPLLVFPDGRAWRLALGGLILLGVALNAPAVLVDLVPHYAAVAGETAADVDRVNWTLRDALPVAVWARLLDGQTDPRGLLHLREMGLPPVWSAGVPAALGAGLLLGVWQMWRAYRNGGVRGA